MNRSDDTQIRLSHGAGGRYSQWLIELFASIFHNAYLDVQNDGALLPWEKNQLVMTTDSYVVEPLFFPGGDIGRLAICGTVNDLAVMGAQPLFLSVAFILEEGFSIAEMKRVAQSMQRAAEEAGVFIVTGDTKVVPRNKADQIYINTAGVGRLLTDRKIAADQASPGDALILTAPVGNHGMAVLSARGAYQLRGKLESDVAPLNGLVRELMGSGIQPHAMRDATRGGLATVLNEIASASRCEMLIEEERIPISESVQSACAILGFDPLYVANEGVLVIVVPETQAEKAVEQLRKQNYGTSAVQIGSVRDRTKPRVLLKTTIGSHRILDLRSGEQLPRIC
jgi:hydrogenase expression/formation protein HypE